MRVRDDPVSILHTVAATLNQVPDVREAMTRILPRLTRALGLHTAWMFLFETGSTQVADVAYTGLPPALRERRARPLREGACRCQDSFRAGELTRAVNIVRCTRLKRATGDKGGLVFHASVPLLSKDRRLGILNVASPGRELFSAEVLRVLSAVGQQVAVAVERSGLFREASRRAEMAGRLEQAVARIYRLHAEGDIAEEVVRTLTGTFGFRSAAVFTQVAFSWVCLAHGGRGPGPRTVPGSGPLPTAMLPSEPFHPGGPDPGLLVPIPGRDPPAAVIAAAIPVRDAFAETVLASYA